MARLENHGKLGAELDSVDAFMEWLEPRHRGEDEYLQAVRGVAENVLDLARDERDFAEARVLQRLTEPDRIICFRVTWEDDDGQFQMNRGFRVQHTNALGPYKGGLRFEADLNLSILKFLAFEQTIKNSLTGLNLGAGKGGANLDPRGLSDREMMRFCQSFMTELHRHIDEDTDVPAGDIGVGEREIGYLFGQYKRLRNVLAGAMTGKSEDFGGSALRQEATGYGAVYFLCAMLGQDRAEVQGKRVVVSGAGNVATHVAEKAIELGANVLTLSSRDGFLCRDEGYSREQVVQIRQHRAKGGDLAELADDLGAEWVADKKPWDVQCDVAIPSATQNELDDGDASALVANGCQIVVEAANMPLTREASRILTDGNVRIAPDKAANAGGVAVSGLEMAQNHTRRVWPAERLDGELREIMRGIHEQCVAEGECDGRVDLVRGADRAGFRRVARALMAYGAV